MEFKLKLFPWDNDEKPFFVTEEGFEWYIDKSTTDWAQRENDNGIALKNILGFFVKKGDDVNRILFDKDKNQVIYDAKSLEAVSSYIDILKLDKSLK